MEEMPRKRSSHKIGLSPEIPTYIGSYSPQETRATIYLYNSEKIETIVAQSTAEIEHCLAKHNGNVWINFTGLANVQWINEFCQTLKIHQLVIEDILNTEQRPKIDLYEDFLYIVLKACQMNPRKELQYEQISMIIKEKILITFQETNSNYFATAYKKLQIKDSPIKKHGTDYLSYVLTDVIVDQYFNIVEAKGDEIETLESELVIHPKKAYLNQLYYLKREYIKLRKVLLEIKDVAGTLSKQDIPTFSADFDIYFRDLYDHCLRILGSIDICREMLTELLGVYMSSVNNKINETMRILTIFASIFIPLTFIASIYGMNFKYMPELDYHFGYYITLGIMGLVVIGLLIFFRRKKWI